MLELTRWMAGYYACTWGQALDAVVPAGVKKQAGTRIGTYFVVSEEVKQRTDDLKLPPKQAEAFAVLCRATEPLTAPDICRLAKCAGPIKALRDRGLILAVKRRLRKASVPVDLNAPDPKARPDLTPEQQAVLDVLTPASWATQFKTFLIHGVTGSRQDRDLSERDRASGRARARGDRSGARDQPDPADDPPFRRRFPKVAVLHSHLSDAERHRHWQSHRGRRGRKSSSGHARRSLRRRGSWA